MSWFSNLENAVMGEYSKLSQALRGNNNAAGPHKKAAQASQSAIKAGETHTSNIKSVEYSKSADGWVTVTKSIKPLSSNTKASAFQAAHDKYYKSIGKKGK